MAITSKDYLIIEYNKKQYSIKIEDLLRPTFAMQEDITSLENTIQDLVNYIESQNVSFPDTHISKADFEKSYQKKLTIQNATSNPNYVTEPVLDAEIAKCSTASSARSEASSAKSAGEDVIETMVEGAIEKFIALEEG